MAQQLFHGRYHAAIEGDFVVFLIGARFRLRDLLRARWLGDAMGEMQQELHAHPETGFLGGENFYRFFPIESILVSYWRSFDDLEKYARAKDQAHFPAWRRFYKEVGLNSNIGIWHETYKVRAGEYETLYGNMPQFGLATAIGAKHINLKDSVHARERIEQIKQQTVLEKDIVG